MRKSTPRACVRACVCGGGGGARAIKIYMIQTTRKETNRQPGRQTNKEGKKKGRCVDETRGESESR